MRALTLEEQQILDERRIRFGAIVKEIAPVLGDFAVRLELQNPHLIVGEPDKYVPQIDAFMRNQAIEENDRAWILTRLAYFIGEVLINRLGGCWVLDEWPDTRYFLRCVVGQFCEGTRKNAMVDPFEVAEFFLAQPQGRNLTKLINEIEAGCRAPSPQNAP